MSNEYRNVPVAQYTLEEIVDAHGLAWTLHALADMCRDKADHLRINWQDKDTAYAWDRAARTVENAALAEVVERVTS